MFLVSISLDLFSKKKAPFFGLTMCSFNYDFELYAQPAVIVSRRTGNVKTFGTACTDFCLQTRTDLVTDTMNLDGGADFIRNR